MLEKFFTLKMIFSKILEGTELLFAVRFAFFSRIIMSSLFQFTLIITPNNI